MARESFVDRMHRQAREKEAKVLLPKKMITSKIGEAETTHGVYEHHFKKDIKECRVGIGEHVLKYRSNRPGSRARMLGEFHFLEDFENAVAEHDERQMKRRRVDR